VLVSGKSVELEPTLFFIDRYGVILPDEVFDFASLTAVFYSC
jgi:hypothetical protein